MHPIGCVSGRAQVEPSFPSLKVEFKEVFIICYVVVTKFDPLSIRRSIVRVRNFEHNFHPYMALLISLIQFKDVTMLSGSFGLQFSRGHTMIKLDKLYRKVKIKRNFPRANLIYDLHCRILYSRHGK